MSAARILYRTRQFWQILRLAPSKHELDRVRSVLNPALLDLFFRMQPGEQSHSLQVYSKLVEAGESDPDLLTAALLHDAGKTRYPLNMWERAWIVIGKALLPRLSQEWSKGDLHEPKRTAYWKRSFIVAERHPDWGAELAARAGASSRAVALIRRHQENQTRHLRMDPPAQGDELKLAQGETRKLEDRLLEKLQAADDES